MPRLKDIIQDTTSNWLEAELDAYDRDKFEKEQVERAVPMDYFRPSSCHLCPRALWYERMGYSKDSTKAQSIRRMNVGTLMHEFIDTKLRGRKGILLSAEEEVSIDNPPVVGHYDAIVRNPKTKTKELIELKTYAEPKKYSKFKLVLPKAAHIMQWNLYSLMTKVMTGLIFYINKNDQSYKAYAQKQNPRILSTLFKKFTMVQTAIDEGERIPYQPKENHAWCDYQTTCETDWFVKGQ